MIQCVLIPIRLVMSQNLSLEHKFYRDRDLQPHEHSLVTNPIGLLIESMRTLSWYNFFFSVKMNGSLMTAFISSNFLWTDSCPLNCMLVMNIESIYTLFSHSFPKQT